MNELTTTTPPNDFLSQKKMISVFTHDALDLEIRSYTLEQAAKKSEEKAKAFRVQADNAVSAAERKVQYKQKNLLSAQDEKTDKAKLVGFFFAGLIGIPVLYFLVGCIAFSIMFEILQAIFPNVWLGDPFDITLILSLLLVITGLIVGMVFFSRKYKAKKNSIQQHIFSAQNELRKSQLDLEKERSAYSSKMETLNAMRDEIKVMRDGASDIRNRLQKIYALGVVPPDYRNMACLMQIDYVFRNDQADTMREATLLCDVRIRHIETMDTLRKLAETMQSIACHLTSIESNISLMSQDIYAISQSAERIAHDTAGTRYAAESTASAAQKLTEYEEMRCAGMF